MSKIFFSAGEVSGDIFAAQIIQNLLLKNPFIQCSGIGGNHMESVGFIKYFDFIPKSAIGLSENIVHLPYFINAFNEIKKIIKTIKPNIIILVDFQGFNLKLAKYAKQLDIPVLYYIPPQDWIWGLKGGPEKIAALTEHILTILPQEQETYAKTGARVSYVGHPLLNLIKDEAKKKLLPDSKNKKICLMPGSRYLEVKRHLPILIHFTEMLKNEFNCEFYLPIASEYLKPHILLLIKHTDIIPISSRDKYSLINDCDLCVAASGNAILETALINTPCIAIYRVSRLTYLLASQLIKSHYITLPNILLNTPTVPELIQDECTALNLLKIAKSYLFDNALIKSQKEQFFQLKELLTVNSNSDSIENIILSYL